MPQNPLLIRFVAVLLYLVILAAMPRQADATDDDTGSLGFEERWQTVPLNGEFICGGLKLDAKGIPSGDDESSYGPKVPYVPLPRSLSQKRRDAEDERLLRELAKARKTRRRVIIEDPPEVFWGPQPDPYAKSCAIGWNSDAPHCANK
jgi:hypothetical protein